MFPNYFIQDIFGSILASLLFPLIFVFPGYVCARALDLFEFKKRSLIVRLGMAVIVSFAVSPIALFLTYRLGSASSAWLLICFFAIGFIILIWRERRAIFNIIVHGANNEARMMVWILSGWAVFAIIFLADLQIGNRLYYNVVSFDYTTRVSLVDAITRTGVPPVMPGYFIGQPVRMTFLYYFWYIPCSLIDQLGGKLVDARMAFIASVVWCGIGLMCLIALYFRLRNTDKDAKPWKSALMGIGALTISGLDIYPALIFLIGTRLSIGSMWPEGDIEHWNEQITAWISAFVWVPHHVVSVIVCLLGILLIQSIRGKGNSKQLAAVLIAGLAFASATGLSIWVTATFALFWAGWMLILFFYYKEYRVVFWMLITGVVALLFLIPFIVDLLSGGSSVAAGEQAALLAVRTFRPALPLVSNASPIIKNLVNLVFLPINYFLELGFYLVVGWLWLHRNVKEARTKNPYFVPEILLLVVASFVGTFVRSNVGNNGIVNNDLGWRVWLFGQFILLIWSADIGQEFLQMHTFKTYLMSKSDFAIMKRGRSLAQLLIVGVATSIFSLALLRFFPIMIDMGITGVPNALSPDTQFGPRSFAARQAYEYLRDSLPENVIVQYNPNAFVDRPSGLYGTRQMVISDHSSYGLSLRVFKDMQSGVGAIFRDTQNDWQEIDQICRHYLIDVVLISDQDPIWQILPILREKRQPLYINSYYAIFGCGNFISR